MPIETSDCVRHFGWDDFDPARLDKKSDKCPVRGCSATLFPVPYSDRNKSDRTLPWCKEHGIRLHSNTFVYWNGPDQRDEARLRNFIVGHDLVRAIALRKGMKAEAHRLGFEMSEDALSWNVFESLAVAGKLREVTQFLTGRTNSCHTCPIKQHALGAFYRRLSARIGKARAVTATARKIAVLFYNAVQHGMEYVDPGASFYETRYRTRVIDNLHRRAKAFGFVLQPVGPTSGEAVS